MKKVQMRSGTFDYDDQFLPIVTNALNEGKTGTLFNPYDNCFIFMDDIEAIEDEFGNMIDKELVSSVPPIEISKTPEQIRIEQLESILYKTNPDEAFLLLNVEITSLEDLKTKKIEQLNYLCNQDILSGFASSALGIEHTYGFSYEDQQNIASMLTLMNADSTITSTYWKTKDAGVLLHTKDEFLVLCKDAQSHKQGKIATYWAKKSQVETLTSKDEIIAIIWIEQ